MDNAERQGALQSIDSLLEEIGYLHGFVEDMGEMELLKQVEIADLALRAAKATVKEEDENTKHPIRA